MDFFAEFAVNETVAKDGVFVLYSGDVEFKIAKHGTRAYRNFASPLFQRNERVLKQKGEAAENKATELIIAVMANTILVGWKGDLKYQGQPLGDYTVEKAKKLLAHETFRDWVDAQSKNVDLFKEVQEDEEADAKN